MLLVERKESGVDRRSGRVAGWATVGLPVLLAVWLVWFFRLHAEATFAQYHDDTILMSSAKALASGDGYIMPSVPGPRGLSPAQTKYPILYPWILSLVWRWNPQFPANVGTALAVTAVFACAALVLSYKLMRRLGVPEPAALALTALCAFQPIFVVLSTKVLSDVPMVALTLAAVLACERALDSRAGNWCSVAAGVLTAAAILTRTIGVAVLLATLLLGVYRRRFRQAAVFAAASIPLVALGIWIAGNNHALDAWAAQGGPGFRNNWLFYTSYLGFWKLSVSSLGALLALASDNLFMCLLTPAMYFQFPPSGGWFAYLYLAVSLAILAGVVRTAREQGLGVIHVAFALHSAVIVCWTNREMVDRFFLPFLPLFCAGLWSEGRHVARLIAKSLWDRRPLIEKLLAGGVAMGAIWFFGRGVAAGWAYDGDYANRAIPAMAALGEEKNELYRWLERETDRSTRLVAWNDAEIWLHSGRQGMRPITFSTRYYYDRDGRLLEAEMQQAFDTARHIGARYWVRVDGEFADGQVEKRVDALLRRPAVVFSSAAGRVRVYAIDGDNAHGH